MRGKLTDQDLTDYALNELDSHQRLYVESMLAVSVECRNDVYEMLDVAQMLEEGFVREVNQVADATLTTEQRARLTARSGRRFSFAFVQKAAASLAMAACAAFAVVNPHFWNDNAGARKVAAVSSQVSEMVSQAVGPVVDDGDIASWVNLESFADESSDLMQAASDAPPEPGVVCTPPSWLDNADVH